MSDVEKVEEGGAPGKRERLTLKLGDRLKAAPILAKASTAGKPFTTVEVRSKKKKVSPELGGRVSSGVESRSMNGGGLTAQEQLFRINAINMADSVSQEKERLASLQQAESAASPVEAEEVSAQDGAHVETVENDAITGSGATDMAHVVPTAEIVPDAPGRPSSRGAHDDKNKKYSSRKVKEKEGGAKKVVSAKSSPKHSKLDIENALSGIDDRCVLRAPSNKRRGASFNSGRTRISKEITIEDKISVRNLAMAMAEKVDDVLRVVRHVGIEANVDTKIGHEIASEIAIKFGHRPKVIDNVQVVKDILDVGSDCDFAVEPRPPVVTVMGHVDHGKTSLLDVLRKSRVVEQEFRGITQHIGAYQIDVDGKKITLLDTPGHEAFADMRARGANVTDIVVLVVAADDGVMPQTIESINHVKAAGVDMVVAVNKIDKGDADVARISNELLKHGVVSEELGGDVILVPVSAKTGENLDKLKSAILLVAEMLELKAPVDCRAQGVVIESKVDRGCGVVITVIVQKGTLRKGDVIVVGDGAYGKVRNMFDDADMSVSAAFPSTPVRVLGLSAVPKAGDTVVVVPSEKHARALLTRKAEIVLHTDESPNTSRRSFDGSILSGIDNNVEEVNIILKADVIGSLEAVLFAIAQISHEEVKFNVLHKEVGDVTKSDVLLAEVSSAIIMAFNVKIDAQARDLVRTKNVDIRDYQVIYDLTDDLRDMVSGRLKPVIQEVQVGLLVVRQVFSGNKSGIVVGCYVTDGAITRGSVIDVCRGDAAIYRGTARALRRFKDDVKEVTHGLECGVLIEGIKDIAVGDTIKVLDIVERARGI